MNRIVYEGFLSSNGSHYDLRGIFRALAAEGLEVHIYPSRDNSDYRALADEVPGIFYYSHLAPEKLFEEIKQYDFGWTGFKDTLNTVHLGTVMPNKLFEYIACGLPVISFPHKALRNFLETQRMGLVIDTVYGLAEQLQSPEMMAVRKNVRRHRWDFTVEVNMERIMRIYQQLCDVSVPSVTNKYHVEQEAHIHVA